MDNGSGTAQVLAGPNIAAVTNGVFSAIVSKEDMGLDTDADAAAWNVNVTLIYPDGTKLVKTVKLYTALSAGTAADGDMTYGAGLKAGTKGKIKANGAELEYDASDGGNTKNIQITALSARDLPPLEMGMINVTGKYKGFRFLPHHAKFSKKMRMTLPYDKTKLPAGKVENDIRAYYFNDRVNRWMPVERESIKTTSGETVNLTNHFTDFINAVIVVPDHPQVQNFNPNLIKDLKAALPGTGITVIEPPSANNKGDAVLNFQIDIPPGRNGVQPSVAINYNSSGGEGICGYGWDMAVRSVSCDTRWGVPRYDTQYETESYILDGEQLLPTARAYEYAARTDQDKRFYARVEGRFQRIIRKVADAANTSNAIAKNYYWQVTDKDGTVNIYGETPADASSKTMIGPSSGTYMWALRSTTDKNGNYVKYYYNTDAYSSDNNLLLDHIMYTGHGSDEGYYQVKFNYADKYNVSGSAGSGVKTDCRGGFIKKSTKKLSSVEVYANNTLVRKYVFTYTTGPFFRELLTNIQQYGSDGTTLIESGGHRFEYYKDINGDAGVFDANTVDTAWQTKLDESNTEHIDLLGLVNLPNGPSAISSNITKSWGENYSISGGLEPWFSINVNWGYSNSSGHTVYSLTDLDGDGIPDEIFTASGNDNSYKWRPNLWSLLDRSKNFADYTLPSSGYIDGLTAISKDESKSNMIGGGVSAVGVGASLNHTDVNSSQKVYMLDVNGDGLPDLVDNGIVKFAVRTFDSSGNPVIKYDCSSKDTEVEVGSSLTLDVEALKKMAAEKYLKDIKASPLISVIKKWDVPYTGTIKIDGDVSLADFGADTGTATQRETYTTADGVWVSIQHNGAEKWREQIQAIDYTAHTPLQSSVGSINVTAGDRIYFRVQSYYDGMFDRVKWTPKITYTDKDANLVDVNGTSQSVFSYTDDFTLAGRRDISVNLNYYGTVRIAGDLIKTGITSDNIRVRILLRKTDPVTHAPIMDTNLSNSTQSLVWNEVSSIPMGTMGPEENGTEKYMQVPVCKGDEIVLRVESDSNIDLTKLQWHPIIYYNSIRQIGDEPVPPAIDTSVTDTTSVYAKYTQKVYAPFDMDFYPVNINAKLTDPQTVLKPLLKPKALPSIDADENLVIRLRGEMSKSAATSQDITVMMVINSDTNTDGTIIEGTGTTVNVCVIPKELTGSCFALPDNYVILKPNSTNLRSLLPIKNLRVKLLAGTKADMNTITWDPKLRYSSMKYSTWSPEWIYKDLGPAVESPTPYEADLITENETWIRNMHLKPGFIETGSNTTAVRFALTVKRPVELVGKGIFYVSSTITSDQLVSLRDVRVGEKLYMEAFTNSSTSYSHVTITEPVYIPGVISNFYFGDGTNNIINKFADRQSDLFATGYRGWAVAGLKDTPEILKSDYTPVTGESLGEVLMMQDENDYMKFFRYPSYLSTSAGYPLDESKLTLAHINSVTYTATGVTGTVTDMDQVIFSPSPYDPDVPGNTINMWKATDSLYCTNTDMCASRIGQKYIKKLSIADIVGSISGTDCTAHGVNRVSESSQWGLSVSAFGLNAFGSLGNSNCVSDFFDMNGDGFPDFVSDYIGVQYTRAEGGMSNQKSGNIETSNSVLCNVGAGSGTDPIVTKPNGQGEAGSDGQTPAGSESKGMTMSGSFSFSGSVSYGTSYVTRKLMDINGDGLPDMVWLDTYSSIQDYFTSSSHHTIKVQLNEGYGNFGPEQDWDMGSTEAAISNNQSTSGGAGIGISGTIDTGAVSVGATCGVSGGISRSKTLETLMDVNGDGLPDYVAKDGSVRYNTGSGFTDFYSPSDTGLDDSYSESDSINAGSNYGFSIKIRIPLVVCTISIGGSYAKNQNEALSKQNSMVMDVNGDGYPDRIKSDSVTGGQFDINYNNVGRTCLLKSVQRPMGSKMFLDYTRSVNTYDQPKSKWNLTSVTETALAGDTALQQSLTTSLPDHNIFYAYSDGKYDKYDREFLGYSNVTETARLDAGTTRVTCREYCNDNRYGSSDTDTMFSYKGILLKESVYDGSSLATPHYEKIYTYEPTPTPLYSNSLLGYTISKHPDSRSYFPKLLSTLEKFYDNGGYITKREEFSYDGCGNVSTYTETGSESGDVVTASVGYNVGTAAFNSPDVLSMKSINLAQDITVTDGSATLLRQRHAGYDSNDNLTSVQQYSSATHSFTTTISYDNYGNMTGFILPANGSGHVQSFTYTYDTTLDQYVVSIEDNNGYKSTAEYDYNFGKILRTIDENNQSEAYTYDIFGRVTDIYGPNETKSGTGVAAHYSYYPDGISGENIPYAVTKNRDMYLGDSNPIKIITYTDGTGRVIQTKKDALVSADGVNSQESMIVSGRVEYDAGGRMLGQYYPVYESKISDVPVASEGGAPDTGNTAFNTATAVYKTAYSYDAFDRNLVITYPDDKTTSFDYRVDSGRVVAKIIDADDNYKETYRDSEQLIREVKERDDTVLKTTISTTYNYDPVGELNNVMQDSTGKAVTTNIVYDLLGRRKAIDNPDTGLVTMTYDDVSNMVSKQTANLKASTGSPSITYGYNAANQLVTVSYPAIGSIPAETVSYTYGANGAADYGAGRVTAVNYPVGSKSFKYDVLGDVISERHIININGGSVDKTTAYTWDNLGRMLTLTYPDGEALTYGYDSGGLLTSVQGAASGTTTNYVKHIRYDVFGKRLDILTGSGESVGGELSGIGTRYQYNADNQRLYSLVTAKRDSTGSWSTAIQSLTYSYDGVGNILSINNTMTSNMEGFTTETVNRTFGYDGYYRLTSSAGVLAEDGTTAKSYFVRTEFDNIHNMTSKDQVVKLGSTDVAGLSYKFGYNYTAAQPHAPGYIVNSYPSSPVTRNCIYDSDGNLINYSIDTFTRTLTWDAENRLRSSADSDSAVNESYQYDESGQRSYKVSQVLNSDSSYSTYYSAYANQYSNYTVQGSNMTDDKHIYAGNQRIASVVTINTDSPSVFYYQTDHLGSTGYLSNTDGDIKQHCEYTPWGENWFDNPETPILKYKFTGKEQDNTGLYYFGARYYDSVISLWVSPDPILEKYLDAGGKGDQNNYRNSVFNSKNLALYSYGVQNPLVMVDPDGLTPYEFNMTIATPIGGGHLDVSFDTDKTMPLTDVSFGMDIGAKAAFILYKQFDLPSMAGLESNLELGAVTLNSDIAFTAPVLGPIGIAGDLKASLDMNALKDINSFKDLTNLNGNVGVGVFGFDVGGSLNADVSMKKTFDSMTTGLEMLQNSVENLYKNLDINLQQ
jgi:RHS repeat-associated protein